MISCKNITVHCLRDPERVRKLEIRYASNGLVATAGCNYLNGFPECNDCIQRIMRYKADELISIPENEAIFLRPE